MTKKTKTPRPKSPLSELGADQIEQRRLQSIQAFLTRYGITAGAVVVGVALMYAGYIYWLNQSYTETWGYETQYTELKDELLATVDTVSDDEDAVVDLSAPALTIKSGQEQSHEQVWAEIDSLIASQSNREITALYALEIATLAAEMGDSEKQQSYLQQATAFDGLVGTLASTRLAALYLGAGQPALAQETLKEEAFAYWPEITNALQGDILAAQNDITARDYWLKAIESEAEETPYSRFIMLKYANWQPQETAIATNDETNNAQTSEQQ